MSSEGVMSVTELEMLASETTTKSLFSVESTALAYTYTEVANSDMKPK